MTSVGARNKKTLSERHIAGMPVGERDKSVSASLRNDRKDLFVDKKIAFDHFRQMHKEQ